MVRAGIGFDAHRFAEGLRLVLGGVSIEHPRGLAGHSDADVLSHAVADALLGAISAGDIGRHFPDSDPRWKDACSLEILRQCAEIVRTRTARIVNVDASVIAEEPRLAPHIEAMRQNMATALGIRFHAVSVKATTVEQMGAIGRGEGIAAMATAAVDV